MLIYINYTKSSSATRLLHYLSCKSMKNPIVQASAFGNCFINYELRDSARSSTVVFVIIRNAPQRQSLHPKCGFISKSSLAATAFNRIITNKIYIFILNLFCDSTKITLLRTIEIIFTPRSTNTKKKMNHGIGNRTESYLADRTREETHLSVALVD